MGKLSVITKKVNEPMKFEDIDNTLEAMQEKVGGYLEAVRLSHNIDLWVNDSGMIDNLPLNIVLIVNGEVKTYIYGDLFFAASNSEGETLSLSVEQGKWIVDSIRVVGTVETEEGKSVFLQGLLIS